MADEKTKEEAAVEGAPTEDSATDSDDEEVEVPAKFKDLVETIEQLPVLELAELVKVLEKKFGVSAAVAAAPVAVAGGGEGEEVVKDSYDVEITEAGSSKIQVIKVVKEITGKGLKEAKDIVDGAPVVVAAGVTEEVEANDLKEKLEEAGATVNLK